MSCSTNSTVMRRVLSADITTSISPNFSSIEMPLVGSSSSSTRGWPATAIAMSRSLRTPCGNVAARASR